MTASTPGRHAERRSRQPRYTTIRDATGKSAAARCHEGATRIRARSGPSRWAAGRPARCSSGRRVRGRHGATCPLQCPRRGAAATGAGHLPSTRDAGVNSPVPQRRRAAGGGLNVGGTRHPTRIRVPGRSCVNPRPRLGMKQTGRGNQVILGGTWLPRNYTRGCNYRRPRGGLNRSGQTQPPRGPGYSQSNQFSLGVGLAHRHRTFVRIAWAWPRNGGATGKSLIARWLTHPRRQSTVSAELRLRSSLRRHRGAAAHWRRGNLDRPLHARQTAARRAAHIDGQRAGALSAARSARSALRSLRD